MDTPYLARFGCKYCRDIRTRVAMAMPKMPTERVLVVPEPPNCLGVMNPYGGEGPPRAGTMEVTFQEPGSDEPVSSVRDSSSGNQSMASSARASRHNSRRARRAELKTARALYHNLPGTRQQRAEDDRERLYWLSRRVEELEKSVLWLEMESRWWRSWWLRNHEVWPRGSLALRSRAKQ